MAIEVATAADLNNVRNNLSGDYIQTADIDLAGWNWNSIGGWNWPADHPDHFRGTYNGNGFVIYNLTRNLFLDTEGDVQNRGGLFCVVGTGGRVTNTHLRNIDFDITGMYGSQNGGIAAAFFGASAHNCSVTGTIVAERVGAGMLAASLTDGSISRCWVGGSVTAGTNYVSSYVGGMVGTLSGAAYLTNCYSRADVTARTIIGGLVGQAGGSGNIEHCYSTGLITSTHHTEYNGAGGLTGKSTIDGTYRGVPVINSYWDYQTSGATGGGGTPRSTAEMTYPENFTTTFIDWDFTNIWTHDPTYTINDGYPPFGDGFNIWVYKSGAWQPVTDIWAHKGGAWQPVSSVDVNKDGWKPI